MGIRLRRGWASGIALAGLVFACDDFEASPPVDAGTDAAAMDASSNPDVIGPVNDGGGDAGDPCGACRSGQCHPDGGCFPQVFVTLDSYPGDLSPNDGGPQGVDRADEICNEAAKSGARPGKFKAWLSTSKTNAIGRITDGFAGGSERPVVDSNGARVAESYQRIVAADGGLLLGIARSQNGGTVGADIVWTGSGVSGQRSTIAAVQCLDWTTRDAGSAALTGQAGASDSEWTQHQENQCSKTAHLYCFETVP